MKIQSLADGVGAAQIAMQLEKIRKRLVHSTEDVDDGELQKMVSFVFANMDKIEKLVEGNEI